MKEKKIEDYIHLYLGCEVETPTRRYKPEGGKSYKAVGKIMDIDLVIKQVGIHFPEEDIHDLKNYPFDQVKPLLSPLSSITEEERFELRSLVPAAEDLLWLKNVGETTRWLLSKHFDLFGLIESGLALDKTLVKN